MIMSTIMVVGRTAKQVKFAGYKIKVNENSFLVFESKKHYNNIMELERSLFGLVNEVLKEYEYEVEEYDLFNPIHLLGERFDYIEFGVKERPLTKVYVIEFEKNENLDHPFEIMFPTLVYFFMTKHDKEEVYSNYKLFCKKIESKKLVLAFKFLRREIRKAIQLK